MALITVLFGLLVEHYAGTLEEFRRFRWFQRLTDAVRGAVAVPPGHPMAVAIAVLALPVAAVLLAVWLLAGLSPALGFIASLLLLLYSFGSYDMEAHLGAFLDARLRDDEDSARWQAAQMLGAERLPEPEGLHRAVIETAVAELNERVVAVIFWFMLLGPAGALLYRLAAQLRARFRDDEEGLGNAAARLHCLLDWAPARVTAFGYALSGSFVEAMQYRRESAGSFSDRNRGILVMSGLGALQYPRAAPLAGKEQEIASLRATSGLLRRTLILWLAALALLTVAGWG